MNNLIIAYGDENITLNRNDEHFILSKEEVEFLIQSLLNAKHIQKISLS